MMHKQPWQRVAEAEDAYFDEVSALYAAGPIEQLRLALPEVTGRDAALRVLLRASVDVVDAVSDLVFPLAAATHGPVALAQDVMKRASPQWLANQLPGVVDRVLDSRDGDWEDYRRSAYVLRMLDQTELLAHLVEKAAVYSDDIDIADVIEDYGVGAQLAQEDSDSGTATLDH